MGMSFDDFLNLTPRQLTNAIQGYIEREDRINKEQWERTRLIYAAINNKPVYGYKIRYSTPDKMLPFPWDNEGGRIPDQDELDQLRKDVWEQEP
jgi:hypothetical protein